MLDALLIILLEFWKVQLRSRVRVEVFLALNNIFRPSLSLMLAKIGIWSPVRDASLHSDIL